VTTDSLRAYRDSADEFGTHVDVLLACYDALTDDIRSAGSAVVAGDVPARCRHSHRALLLLGHLESWVSLLDDDPLQQALTGFYQYVRAELLRLQAAAEVGSYTILAMRVCEARAAWQRKQANAKARLGPPSTETHFSCSM
jgi:flagellin-specific chaperone FliS